MPPPRPLTNINSTARPQSSHPFSDQQLTPRTPHSGSRTSRLEQGFSKIPLSETNDAEYDDQSTLQSAPLLASSSTARFSVRERQNSARNAQDNNKRFQHPTQFLSKFLDRLPLAFGVFMSGVLLILIVLSLTRPDALHKYIGAKAPVPSTSSIDADSTPTATLIPSLHSTHVQTDAKILSYDSYTKFPLTGSEYSQECAKMHNGYVSHGDYWDTSVMGDMDVLHGDDKSVCSSTIVYMLDGTVGLTADLAIMAQAAALARERNRTFLVDDTYWNRGKWSDYFEDVRITQPGPEPGCKVPPPNEMVACPRTARHWVITARTAKYHFAHGFDNHYENAYGHNLERLKPIFDSALESFDNTILPNSDIRELVELAREEFLTFMYDAREHDKRVSRVYVGAHIRRGDMKSLSYTYRNRRIPLREYLSGVKAAWDRIHAMTVAQSFPVVYLATDSSDSHLEFSELYEGGTFSLFDAKNPTLRRLASQQEYNQTNFNGLDLQSRVSATKGMLIDLALVTGIWAGIDDVKPEATVCALSSTICRLAPLGLGWDHAFGHLDDLGNVDEKNKNWIDVDEKGLVVPVWRAFLLFN